jgi:hypothetical protein
MNRNKKFENILSECLDRIFKGETIEQCLHSHPEQAGELEPLLRTAVAAKKASHIQPRPEFRASARYQFQAALRDMEARKNQKKSFFGWLPQLRLQSGWSMAIVAVLIVVLGGGGTVAAASTSMPDSALYSLKLATENVQLAVTPSDVGKAELNAKFAGRRAEEIDYTVTQNNAQEVQNIASLLSTNMENITLLTTGDNQYTDGMGGSNAGVANNAEMATNALNEEQPMLGVAAAPPVSSGPAVAVQAPDQTPRPGATDSLSVPDNDVRAPMVVVPPEQSEVKTFSGTEKTSIRSGDENNVDQRDTNESEKLEKIRQIIEETYLSCMTSLQASLEKAAPEVKPAIRLAIARVEAEYFQALSNLKAANN